MHCHSLLEHLLYHCWRFWKSSWDWYTYQYFEIMSIYFKLIFMTLNSILISKTLMTFSFYGCNNSRLLEATQTSPAEVPLHFFKRGWNLRKLFLPQYDPEGHWLSSSSQSPSFIPHVFVSQYSPSYWWHNPLDRQ